MTNLLLFFHLLGAFCFFAGGAVVGVLQLAAIRTERPSQTYAYLRLAPIGAALVGAGALLTLGFGIALAEHEGRGFSPAWVQAALGLWVAAMVLGAYGGRTARHARHLASRLAAEGDAPSEELRALVGARGPLYASYASFVLLLAIVVLMVWQPGSAPQFAMPSALKAKLVAGDPRIAYAPTHLPGGYSFSHYAYSGRAYDLTFIESGNPDPVDFSVRVGCSGEKPFWAQQRLRVNRTVLLYHYGENGQQVWVCRHGVLLEAAGLYPPRTKANDLATLVAYAKPVR